MYKFFYNIVTLISVSMLFAGQTFAAEPPATPKGVWKGAAELGYISTTGNTETETIKAKGSMSVEKDQWRHKTEVTALNSSDQETTTAEKYTFGWQSDYMFSKNNYALGSIDYEDDRFSGYDYRVTETVGLGHRTIDEKDLTLDLEIGPGARQSKLDDGSSEDEFIIRGAAKLAWTISPSSKFSEVLKVDFGEDATITTSTTELTTKINTSLAMKVTYVYKNTSDVPPGADETDTETAVTLVYSF